MLLLSFIDRDTVLSMLLLSFIDPATVLSMLLLSFIHVVFLSEANLYRFFIVYVCIAVGDPVIKRRNWRSIFNKVTFCVCPMTEPGLAEPYAVVVWVFSE
jgi:hypothetical protein